MKKTPKFLYYGTRYYLQKIGHKTNSHLQPNGASNPLVLHMVEEFVSKFEKLTSVNPK